MPLFFTPCVLAAAAGFAGGGLFCRRFAGWFFLGRFFAFCYFLFLRLLALGRFFCRFFLGRFFALYNLFLRLRLFFRLRHGGFFLG